MKWTPEQDDSLREYVAANLSCSQIADEISTKHRIVASRNAVIGRLHRLGIKTRTVTNGLGHLPSKKARAESVPVAKPKAAPKPQRFTCEPITGLRQADVVPLHLSLIDLEPDQCRYPFGDGPYTFCGCAKFDDSPYCEPHDALSRRDSMQGVNYRQSEGQRAGHRKYIVSSREALKLNYGDEEVA